jgi:hypothetical protein
VFGKATGRKETSCMGRKELGSPEQERECDDARVARARAYDDCLHCLTSQTSWTTQASVRELRPQFGRATSENLLAAAAPRNK